MTVRQKCFKVNFQSSGFQRTEILKCKLMKIMRCVGLKQCVQIKAMERILFKKINTMTKCFGIIMRNRDLVSACSVTLGLQVLRLEDNTDIHYLLLISIPPTLVFGRNFLNEMKNDEVCSQSLQTLIFFFMSFFFNIETYAVGFSYLISPFLPQPSPPTSIPKKKT